MFLRRKSPLPAPVEPFRDFLVTVCVVFPEPTRIPAKPGDLLITNDDVPPTNADEPTFIGYYRNIGMRVQPSDVPLVLRENVDDGDIHWGETEWEEVDIGSLDRDIRSQVDPPIREGVWYESGRAYFTDW
jgi:hypothetical protein